MTLQSVNNPESRGYVDSRYPSGTIRHLLEIDPEVLVITNDREMVYILTGRPAFSVPLGRDQFTQTLREDLPHQMEAYRERLANGAVLALFDDYWVRDFIPSGATLIEGLILLTDADDGALYAAPQSRSD